MIRFAVLVLAGAIAAAAGAGNARAALFFLFAPTAAGPGDLVTARTSNTPAGFDVERVRPFGSPIRLYLVANAVAGDVRSRFDPRLYYVGALIPDAHGRGVLRFRVPPLDAGAYTLASWCPACAPYSLGRTFSSIEVGRNIVPRYRRLMLLRVRPGSTCPVTGGRQGTTVLSTRLPSGVLAGRTEPDGSIFWKFGWLPDRPSGMLSVSGERLDGPSAPMRVLGVFWGHSSTGRGSWASAVSFPSEGCWRVTAGLRDVRLSVVVRVRRQ